MPASQAGEEIVKGMIKRGGAMFWWGRRQVYELPVQASANYITKQIDKMKASTRC
jgi:hypothetical protein